MTNETVPELPDWVKVLIDDARNEGYDSGHQEGMSHAFSMVENYSRNQSRW